MKVFDFVILACLIILITLQPFFLEGSLNYFELGLYLPGIAAILDAQSPFRDFFHLRGPFELYIPAFLMKIFGEEIAVLKGYFYVGNVLTIIVFLLIAKEIFRTRFILYSAVLVIAARTFPRVVCTYWGGLRYTMGALAILLAIKFFKTQKNSFLILSGIASAVAGLISLEIGVSVIVAVFGALFLENRAQFFKRSVPFLSGVTMIVLPYGLYLLAQGALSEFIESTWVVATQMQKTFDLSFGDQLIRTPIDAIKAMVNPGHDSFDRLTPVYLFILFGVIVYRKFKRSLVNRSLITILPVALYGFLLYIGAFRNIGGAQFEMALQPEKIVLFFVLEEIYLGLKDRTPAFINLKSWPQITCVVILILSLGYTLQRTSSMIKKNQRSHKEFLTQSPQVLEMEHLRGLRLPQSQAQDIEELSKFINAETKADDHVLFFDELAIFHFIADRPFVSRFPMITFAWLKESWHAQFLQSLQSKPPQIVVREKILPPHFEEMYFKVPSNAQKYKAVSDFIETHYELIKSTPNLLILRRRP